MAAELGDLIHVYENVLDKDICQSLIDIFNNNQDKHERFDRNRTPNFTQYQGNPPISNEKYLLSTYLHYK